MTPPRPSCWALVCLLALAFGCASTPPEKTPPRTTPLQAAADEWRVTDHLVIVTDGSGTMYVNETFPEAKALTRSFVEALPPADVRAERPGTYEAGLIGFGGDDRMRTGVVPFDRSRLAATAADLKILGEVSGLGGTTPYAAVLDEIARDLRGKSGRAAVVFFSDGVPDDEPAALDSAKRLVGGYQGQLCIHGVHTGTDQEGYDFLKRLSALSGCGGVRAANSLGSGAEVQQLARAVLMGPGRLPPVGAASPCAGAVVRLRGIEFDFDRAEVRSESRPVLEVAAQELARCPEIRVTIGGHTDAIGTDTYNMDLSYKRARATKNFLVEQGIDAGRLEVEGFGETQPIAPNDDAMGRSRNRRVELAPLR